jgi:CubicO group peptidase (beta-lactamase class C family)
MRKVWFLIITGCVMNTANGQILTKIADSIRIKSGIPEMSYAVIGPTSILELHISGHHRIDDPNIKTQSDIRDLFHLGSNTKAITSFIAAILVEQKKINWDTKFFEIFPTWLSMSNPAYEDITLQQLLSHQSGIPAYTEGSEFAILPPFEGEKEQQRKEFVQHVLRSKPLGPAGESYHYSNAGYSLAAVMLEKVSGKTWEGLVTDVLGDQLGMRYKFGWPNYNDTSQPYGHWIENNRIKALMPDNPYKLNLIQPGTDLCMPVTDYAKFVQLNLNGLLGQDNELKAETYKLIHFGTKEYGMGWNNGLIGEKTVSFHMGSAGTFYTYTLIDTTDKRAYVIMMNCAHPLAKQGATAFMNIMMKTKLAD